MRTTLTALLFCILGDGALCQAKPNAEDAWWSSWRGPDCRAIARSGKPPTSWSEAENIRFKVAVPGEGSSSPIVWGDRVYITTAIPTGEQGAAPATPGGGRPGQRGAPTEVHEFAVLAYDRKDGRIAWQRTVQRAVPHEAGHETTTQAASSPLTDGERVYAYFGSRGLHALDLKGEVVWSKQLGIVRTRNGFGEGTSPALHGDTLLVNQDSEGGSFVAAFDKRTGKELWRKERDEQTTWATPLILAVDGRLQAVVPGTRASRGYDLATGDTVWSLAGLTANPIPTPLFEDGLVFLMSGFRGNSIQAVRLAGAKGDLRGTDHVVWSQRESAPYTPSGLVYDGYLYFLRENTGVLSCVDAKTGKVHYEGERLRRFGTTYSSIVGAAGHVYITSRRAKTAVIALGPKFEEVSANNLDETIDSTLAFAGDEIYVRGRKHLYCIARGK